MGNKKLTKKEFENMTSEEMLNTDWSYSNHYDKSNQEEDIAISKMEDY